jgi:hypothetical protein
MAVIFNRIVSAVAINGMLLAGTSVPARAQDKPQAPPADQGQGRGRGGPAKAAAPSEAEQRQAQERQTQRGQQDQQRQTQYQTQRVEQQRVAQQRPVQLQQARRPAQARFQQQVVVRTQQRQMQDDRAFVTNRTSFIAADSSYRYSRGGVWFETNQYGATLLRQAVNAGYDEGFHSGQADRQDRWASNYQDSFEYQDATFGYGGHYVDQTEYSYYFREGFRRGYEDGYGNRHQYGSYSAGRYSVLGAVLGTILVLQSIR